MELLDIRIRRIREIESLDITCADMTLIAIVGENGAGKTTVLFSLLFALTGQMILKGSKEEHVRDTGEGPAWAEVRFRHNDTLYTVRRSMNASTARLTIGEGKTAEKFNGSNKVNQKLLEDGIDPARILQAFLPQGDADKLFKATDSDRAKEALKTFGLSEIEKLDKALGEAMTPLNNKVDSSVAERFDIAKAQLDMATGRRDSLKEGYDKAEADHKALNEAQFTLQRASRIKIANEKYTELKALRSSADDELESLKNTYDTVLADVDRHQADVQNMTDTYDAAKAKLYAHDQFIKNQAQRDKLAQELAEYGKIAAGIEQGLEQMQDDLLPDEIFNKYTDVTLSADDKLGVLRQVKATVDAVDNYRAEVDAAETALTAAAAELEAAGDPEELEADLLSFRKQLAVWEHQAAHSKDGKCATCGQDWAEAKGEDLVGKIAEVKEIISKVVARQNAYKAAAEQHRVAQNAHAHASDNYQVRMEELNGLLKQAESLIPGYTDAEADAAAIEAETLQAKEELARHNAVKADIDQAHKDREILEAKAAGAQRSLDSMQGESLSPEEQEQAHQLITAYDEKKAALQKAATERDSLIGRIDVLDERIGKYVDELAAIEETLAAPDEDEQDVERAKELVKNLEAIQATWNDVSRKWAEASKECDLFSDQVADLQKRMQAQAVVQKKLDVLSGARHILHREQLPLFICSLYTELVSQQWANELESFGCKFTAWQDPGNLEFYARFEDGNERRVYQLSGGERQLAIVAYLFVINRLFSPDLGIIGFDEPTTHVDETFRPIMAEVFRKLAERADEEGMQIFLVDHAPEFLTSFPAAIRLQKSHA